MSDETPLPIEPAPGDLADLAASAPNSNPAADLADDFGDLADLAAITEPAPDDAPISVLAIREVAEHVSSFTRYIAERAAVPTLPRPAWMLPGVADHPDLIIYRKVWETTFLLAEHTLNPPKSRAVADLGAELDRLTEVGARTGHAVLDALNHVREIVATTLRENPGFPRLSLPHAFAEPLPADLRRQIDGLFKVIGATVRHVAIPRDSDSAAIELLASRLENAYDYVTAFNLLGEYFDDFGNPDRQPLTGLNVIPDVILANRAMYLVGKLYEAGDKSTLLARYYQEEREHNEKLRGEMAAAKEQYAKTIRVLSDKIEGCNEATDTALEYDAHAAEIEALKAEIVVRDARIEDLEVEISSMRKTRLHKSDKREG